MSRGKSKAEHVPTCPYLRDALNRCTCDGPEYPRPEPACAGDLTPRWMFTDAAPVKASAVPGRVHCAADAWDSMPVSPEDDLENAFPSGIVAIGLSGQREQLGRVVREVWLEWAREQPNPKASWLVPWEGLSEPEREVDRRIGERLARQGRAPLTEGIDQAALVRWLRAIAAGKIDITPDVESILDAMSAALNRQRRTAPLTEADFELEGLLESLESADVGGWTLADGAHALVKADGGHLSVIQAGQHRSWIVKVREMLSAAPAARVPTGAPRVGCKCGEPSIYENGWCGNQGCGESAGDIPDAIRPEAEPAVQEALRGLERVAPDVPNLTPEETADIIAGAPVHLGLTPESAAMMQAYRDDATVATTPGHVWRRDASGESVLVPTMTHEEARTRLLALGHHAHMADDFLGDPRKHLVNNSYLRAGTLDVLRAYVAGLDAAPVDVPRDLHSESSVPEHSLNGANREPSAGRRIQTENGTGRILHKGAQVGHWWIQLDSGVEDCLPSGDFQVLP